MDYKVTRNIIQSPASIATDHIIIIMSTSRFIRAAQLSLRSYASRSVQPRPLVGLPRLTLAVNSAPSLSESEVEWDLSGLLLISSESTGFPVFQKARSLFVQTQTTPNPNSLQFIPGTPVLSSGGTHEFLDTKAALASPLAIRLMGIEGVLSVFYGPDFVSVQKDEETAWSLIKPEVFSIIMEHFSSGTALFREGSKEAEETEPEDTRILDTDSEVVAMIKDLLATRIRPSIMEDGGDLEFMGFGEETDGLVRIKLKGSCRGCSSSEVTLKSGVERMLMHYVPEVKGVEQVSACFFWCALHCVG